MDKVPAEQQVARITVSAKVEFLPAVIAFMQDISARLGLPDRDTDRLELVVEEACMNVIEHAFDPDEEGYFDVVILRRPGQIVVAVEDQGLPFDFRKAEPAEKSGPGMLLMNAFTDELRFLNLGRRGKRVELIKNLPYKDITTYVSEVEKEGEPSTISVSPDVPLTVRLMEPADAVGVARCVYRSYGYTYGTDDIYFPDREMELLRSGLLTSCVAITPEGEIIGHMAMNRDQPDAKVGETMQAVVDPRYRGRGLLARMKTILADHAREAGMHGVYSEAVAVHPYSQKGNISLGAYETGFLLGFTPATMFFKQIQEECEEQRQTVVLFYLRVNEEPMRDIYPPFHHKAIIRSIYKRNKLRRSVKDTAAAYKEKIELGAASRVDVKVQSEPGRAFMQVKEYGMDLVELVRFRLRELCLRRVDCIYIDLPLSHPAAAQFCASLEMLGFFFAGVIPEMFDGDVLRLQYLNNVDINPDDVSVVSDFGKELLAYVLKAKEGLGNA